MGKLLICVALLAACSKPRVNDIPDAASVDADLSLGDATINVVYVYANTSSALFRLDPDTLAFSKVNDFAWPASVGSDVMTDIAVDKLGNMVGVSYTRVFSVDPTTAVTTLLSSVNTGFNGLSYVPATAVGETGDDVLVGTCGGISKVYRIDPMTGVTTQIGDMGSGYSSSGDLVSVAGLGTFQTAPNNFGSGANGDLLLRLAPDTFVATAVGTGTGFDSLLGVAYWYDKVIAFQSNGHFVTINPNTGVGTLLPNNTGEAWWGAAVTTLAPVIP